MHVGLPVPKQPSNSSAMAFSAKIKFQYIENMHCRIQEWYEYWIYPNNHKRFCIFEVH